MGMVILLSPFLLAYKIYETPVIFAAGTFLLFQAV